MTILLLKGNLNTLADEALEALHVLVGLQQGQEPRARRQESAVIFMGLCFPEELPDFPKKATNNFNPDDFNFVIFRMNEAELSRASQSKASGGPCLGKSTEWPPLAFRWHSSSGSYGRGALQKMQST